MKSFRDESGQTLVLSALLMCILMGFMALAIDVGVLFRAQRRLQTEADAGAIAGALSAYYGGTTWATVAKTASENNGMPSADNYATNNGPLYGSHLGGEYYEVIITEPNATVFMATFGALFGSNTSFRTMTVGARAVAGITPGQSCMTALNQTADDSVDLQGNATIITPHCSVQIDSSSSTALCTTGGKATIETDGIRIVGAQNPQGKCNHVQGNAQTGVAAVPDPFANTVFPNPSSVCNSSNTVTAASVTSATTIPSSTATSSSNLTYSLTCFSAANVTLSGVTLGSSSNANNFYLFENGLVIAGNDTVYGTMDLNSGNFCQGSPQGGGCKFNSGNTLNLTAPANTATTQYAYNGMGFMVNPNAVNANAPQCDNSYQGTLPTVYPSLYPTGATGGCVQMQFGSNSATLNAIVYVPSDVLYLQDSGGSNQFADLVANEIYDKSSTLTITDNYNLEHVYSPLNHVALVE